MPAYEHHLCFVSGQNAPELIGALAPETSCAHVHALVSPEMKAKALDLEKSCLRQALQFTLYELPDKEPDTIKTVLDHIRRKYSEACFAINISGGTKLMAFAGFEWAQNKNIDALYIDTDQRQIHRHSQGLWHKLELPNILVVEDLLSLYGYGIKSEDLTLSAEHAQALRELIDISARPDSHKAFQALNRIACEASRTPELRSNYWASSLLKELLKTFKNSGKLSFTSSNITFTNMKSLQWCKGLWLEEYVRSLLSSLKAEKRISSWTSSVAVGGKLVDNELDALFTTRNRLYFIECKTSKEASSPVYKAFSLRENIGGSFAKSMICSMDKLESSDDKRAKAYNIKTVIGPEIKNLRKHIIDWIK